MKLRMASADGVQDNIKKIAALFPECVTEVMGSDGTLTHKIDFEKLQQNLSDSIVNEQEERYQFTWPDKKKAILLANAPINATLRPCREESVDFDNTQNLYIEGDNLDVLKCLKETYLHKVKMIYIDPPYNTGNDFVYEDDFAETAAEYRANSGQYDDQGNRLVANTESNGRFHTDWLNMIYPRLKVARDLLSDDGVIFISIDDNEVENLKKVCNEIFGEDNFVADFIWHSRQNRDNRNLNGVSIDHEYIICYQKNNDKRAFKGTKRKTEQYNNPDNDIRGAWTSGNMVGLATKDARPNLHYDLINPSTGINYGCPEKGWRYDKHSMARLISENRILWPDGSEGRPRKKVFLNELSEENLPGYSSLLQEDLFTNTATKELRSLLDEHLFPFPKPSRLIQNLIQQVANSDSLILDFFSGSATTAHAVMQLNAEDGGNRKFILVQLPEATDEKSEAYKAGYKNICEIGKERIRRAGAKIREQGTTDNVKSTIDTGFRVLKLDSSNMNDVYYSPAETDQSDLFSLVDNVKSDRTGEDLLFQAMLELGATLDSKIEVTEIAGKTIYNVAEGYFVATFDKDVTAEVITAIAKMQPLYAVMRDTSMADDSTATNFEQIFKSYSPNTTIRIL